MLMWLGERITEKGVGNGISIVLTINIISRVPSDLALLYENFIKGKTIAKGTLAGLIIAAVILLVVVLVLILNGAERRIPVQYSKKMVGRKLMGGQSRKYFCIIQTIYFNQKKPFGIFKKRFDVL